jgi:hypothetical protein
MTRTTRRSCSGGVRRRCLLPAAPNRRPPGRRAAPPVDRRDPSKTPTPTARAVAAGGKVVASFFVLELVYGLVAGSLALLSDAGSWPRTWSRSVPRHHRPPLLRLVPGRGLVRPGTRGRFDRAGRRPRRDAAVTRVGRRREPERQGCLPRSGRRHGRRRTWRSTCSPWNAVDIRSQRSTTRRGRLVSLAVWEPPLQLTPGHPRRRRRRGVDGCPTGRDGASRAWW